MMHKRHSNWRVRNTRTVTELTYKKKIIYKQGFLHRWSGNHIGFKNKSADQRGSNHSKNPCIHPFTCSRFFVSLCRIRSQVFIFFIQANIQKVQTNRTHRQRMLIESVLSESLYEFNTDGQRKKPTHDRNKLQHK